MRSDQEILFKCMLQVKADKEQTNFADLLHMALRKQLILRDFSTHHVGIFSIVSQ